MTETTTTLRQEAERTGTLTFARFMELALYCPNSGYYEREDSRIGRAGDFYTSVSTGPLFGGLLASQFCQWLEPTNGRAFHLVEAGAHDGRLATDILGWLRAYRPEVFARAVYWLVEPSARRKEWQRERLEDFADQVRWVDDLTSFPARGIEGVIFCNELMDAFPVHRLAWDAGSGAWREWGVAWEVDRFVWRLLSPQGDWLAEFERAGFRLPRELEQVLPDGFILEVSSAAGRWWRTAARALKRGRLLCLDYGFTAEEFLRPERSQGTLRAYHRHRISGDLLASPGTQDLTAHVNFTQLRLAGEGEGLATEGLFSQTQFLTRAAECLWRAFPPTAAETRQFQTLTHPEHLGRAFRALIQVQA